MTILAALRLGDVICMEMSGEHDHLRARPAPVTAGAAMLLGSAVILVLTWAFGVDAVESNGARVFFVVLWGFLAYSAYTGAGWVRSATVAVFCIAILGFVNAPSFVPAVQAMPIGDVVAKALAFAALVAFWSPPAHRWFATVKAARIAEGR
ncbi:MAG: hypothetical protein OXK76_03840 [Gammaproteobacteria bacterium]|nr:hypothetical protein [Gammaproteobacteria bacterium]